MSWQVLRLFDRCFFDPATGVAVDKRMAGHLDFGKAHVTNITVRLRATLEICIGMLGESILMSTSRTMIPLQATSGKLMEVVASFKESTDRLKEIYFSHHVGHASRAGGGGADSQNLLQIQSIDPSLASGLRRHEIAWRVESKQEISIIEPLKGDIEPLSGPVTCDWAAQRVWRYVEGDKEGLVTVEYKRYRRADTPTSEELFPSQKAYMQRVRDRIQALATILQDPFDGDGEAGNGTSTDDPVLHTFKALGYTDRLEEGRFALLFEIPKDALKEPGRPVTLAQSLDQNGSIQLEERFFLAHCLGATPIHPP